MKLLLPVLLRGSSRATKTGQTERPRASQVDPMPRWGRAFSAFAVLSNLDTDNAIWLIYLAMRGYSPFAIGLFEMLFHVAKFFTEMPTGIFADLVGRRASLVAACVCGAVSAALLLDPTPLMVSLSFIGSGVSWAFKGGAQEAVVWTLASASADPAEAGAVARRYNRLYSRFLVLTLIAAALGAGVSGFLLRWNPALPFIARAVGVALAIAPLLLMPALRPAQPDDLAERLHPLAHLRAGLAAAWHSPILLGLLLLSALEGTVFTTSNYYTQLYFHGLGYSAAAIGVIFAVGSVHRLPLHRRSAASHRAHTAALADPWASGGRDTGSAADERRTASCGVDRFPAGLPGVRRDVRPGDQHGHQRACARSAARYCAFAGDGPLQRGDDRALPTVWAGAQPRQLPASLPRRWRRAAARRGGHRCADKGAAALALARMRSGHQEKSVADRIRSRRWRRSTTRAAWTSSSSSIKANCRCTRRGLERSGWGESPRARASLLPPLS